MLIYLVTNEINGKQYVGKTRCRLLSRWHKHVCSAKRGSPYALHKAIRKYGPNSFSIASIFVADTEDTLSQAERLFIGALGTARHGYNLTSGGEGASGYRHTEIALERMRNAKLGKKQTQAAIDNRAEALRLSWLTRERRPMANEIRKKISVSLTGRKRDRKAIEKTADAIRGRKHSPETIELMRLNHRSPGMTGRKHSDKTLAKMRESASRRQQLRQAA